MSAIAYCDGSTKGYVGITIHTPNNLPERHILHISDEVTNNAAEYLALIKTLNMIDPNLYWVIYTDSQLVVNQVSGIWGVSSDNLKPYHKECLETIQFRKLNITLQWISRRENEAGLMLDKIKKYDNRATKYVKRKNRTRK